VAEKNNKSLIIYTNIRCGKTAALKELLKRLPADIQIIDSASMRLPSERDKGHALLLRDNITSLCLLHTDIAEATDLAKKAGVTVREYVTPYFGFWYLDKGFLSKGRKMKGENESQ